MSTHLHSAPAKDRRSPFKKPSMPDREEHVKWEYHDFVGKYHLRKIKSEFPIPGLTVTRKQRSFEATRDHQKQVEEWMQRTQTSNTAGMKLKTDAAADFLTMSDTGRASQRVIAALAPAIEKRAEAFHKFKHLAAGKQEAEIGKYRSPHYEEDDLQLDYRKVDPTRDFRYGIMPKQRQREIHHLNVVRNQFQTKAVDVLTTDKLITEVAGKRGPPEAVRETKTRQLEQKYRRRSRFSASRARRQEEANQKALEEKQAAEALLQHRRLSRCASAPVARPRPMTSLRDIRGSAAGSGSGAGFRGLGTGADLSLPRSEGGQGGGDGGKINVLEAADQLRDMYHSRPTTAASVATREFRRRNRFL